VRVYSSPDHSCPPLRGSTVADRRGDVGDSGRPAARGAGGGFRSRPAGAPTAGRVLLRQEGLLAHRAAAGWVSLTSRGRPGEGPSGSSTSDARAWVMS
jgi:hypothetical protein